MCQPLHPRVEDEEYGDAVRVFEELAATLTVSTIRRKLGQWDALITIMDTVWQLPSPELLPNFEEITPSHSKGITRKNCVVSSQWSRS
jgi:hypothetical protein